MRSTTWGKFLKAHWDTLAAIDITSTDIWTMHGLVTIFVLVVMEPRTRRIEIAGTIECHEQLGGMLRDYHRKAARALLA